MPIYEVVYESGSHALASYADDEEARAALTAHHERAVSGVSATPASTERNDVTGVPGPTSWPAERIAKVYVFETHPANYRVGEQVPADEIDVVINSLKDSDGLVNAQEAAAAVRTTSSPFITPENPHDSMYAMDHTELDWSGE